MNFAFVHSDLLLFLLNVRLVLVRFIILPNRNKYRWVSLLILVDVEVVLWLVALLALVY